MHHSKQVRPCQVTIFLYSHDHLYPKYILRLYISNNKFIFGKFKGIHYPGALIVVANNNMMKALISLLSVFVCLVLVIYYNRESIRIILQHEKIFQKSTHRFQKKFAFVVGNDEYKYFSDCSTCKNDASTMGHVLESLNFVVRSSINKDKDNFEKKFRIFLNLRQNEIQSLGVDDHLTVFFFSGHGIELNDEMYYYRDHAFAFLNSAMVRKPNNVEDGLLLLSELHEKFQNSGGGTVLFIVNSCRNVVMGKFHSAPRKMCSASGHYYPSILYLAEPMQHIKQKTRHGLSEKTSILVDSILKLSLQHPQGIEFLKVVHESEKFGNLFSQYIGTVDFFDYHFMKCLNDKDVVLWEGDQSKCRLEKIQEKIVTMHSKLDYGEILEDVKQECVIQR